MSHVAVAPVGRARAALTYRLHPSEFGTDNRDDWHRVVWGDRSERSERSSGTSPRPSGRRRRRPTAAFESSARSPCNDRESGRPERNLKDFALDDSTEKFVFGQNVAAVLVRYNSNQTVDRGTDGDSSFPQEPIDLSGFEVRIYADRVEEGQFPEQLLETLGV